MNVLEQLRGRFTEVHGQLTALAERAQNENRSYTEAEAANEVVLRNELTAVHDRIETQVGIERSVQQTTELLSSVPAGSGSMPPAGHNGNGNGNGNGISPYMPGMPGIIRTEGRNPDSADIVRSIWQSPGEYMADVIHAQQGDFDARERIQRAIANEVTGDVPGLVPTPIIGDVINVIDASRPATASCRAYGMPQYGASFTRPKVAQHTVVGVQGTQKTELPSQKFTVNPLSVVKQTYGGSLDVAFQVIDWTNPSALDAITNDLADQYAIMTEGAATAAIVAAAAANAGEIVTVPTAGAADVQKALWTAAANVYSGCKKLPDTLWVSVDYWAGLGVIVDSTGRPLFPYMGATNAPGSNNGASTFTANPLGLQLVVSPEFPTKTMIMGNSSFAEVYEDRRGALRVVEPKLLGWEIAFYGYFAPLMTANGAFVAITFTVPPITFAGDTFSSAPSGDDEDDKPAAANHAAKKA